MPNVFVNRKPVGRLTREEIARFAYDEGIGPSQAVSLLMPVQEASYLAERPGVLHPVFDMSLPEGPLREALSNMFAKALPVFDDLALLEVVGRSLIGRLRFGGASELDDVPAQNLKDLLHHRGTDQLFRELLTRYARYSGVAGVQPKLLIRDDGSLGTSKFSPVETGARITTRGSTHLVKTFDAQRYPGLATNEYVCLLAAKAAGLAVMPVELSDDGNVLVIERFDLKPDGTYLGFEDGCALDGRLAREKYEGSYEQLAGTLSTMLTHGGASQNELERFFRSLVLSVAVRNGDAHRKNFGVCYDDASGHVWLAPTYDVVTTAIYLPTDTLALMWEGSKRWPGRKKLEKFGMQRCLLSQKAARGVIEEVAAAVERTAEDWGGFEATTNETRAMLENLRIIWREGVAEIRD